MKMSRIQLYVVAVFAMFLSLPGLNAEKPVVHKYSYIDLFTVGVEEAKNEGDEPYQFFTIANISCDIKENIYVLDYQARQVKKYDRNGVFVRRYFGQGKGPKEVANPFSVSINNYSNHIFVLHEYGFNLKEFDIDGNDIKNYLAPKQFFGSFQFLNKDEYICMNSSPKVEPFNNFFIVNISQRKIVKEFANTNTNHVLNYKQCFAIQKGKRLWTCMGNEMKLKAFDLETDYKVEEILIPGNFKENTVLESAGSGGMMMAVPIIYNTAQPFIIEDQLFILLIINDYQKKNGKIDRFPVNCQRIIYQVIGNRFEKLGSLKDGEEFYYETVSKKRLILSANEPYPHFKVLEFK